MFTARNLMSIVARFRLVRFVFLVAVVAVPAVAQTPATALGNGGSVRGRIFDADTGQLITQELVIEATLDVAFPQGSRQMDIAGEFVFPDLQPGDYRLEIREKENRFPIATRKVQVTAGAAITRADIYLRLRGEISVVVVDSAGEPVQDSTVMLVSLEYVYGHAVHAFTQQKTSDDRGHVNLSQRVEAGHPYFLLALPPQADKPTSITPGTPLFEATWYPGRPGVLQPFVLRSAERKNVELVMQKKQTYCVEGRLTADGLPAALAFEVAIPEVGKYVGLTGGTRGIVSRGKSDASGQFQVCGLWPGEFLLTAGLNDAFYGRTTISIVDKDLRDVTLNVRSPLSLAVEIRWDNLQRAEGNFRLAFVPLSRAAFYDRERPSAFQPLFESMTAVVPSKFTVSLPAFTDYIIAGGFLPIGASSDTYFKEVICDGTASRNILELSDAPCNLSITVGTDMGKLEASILDRDNNPDSNSSICVSPISATTREQIAETGTCSVVTSPERGSVSIAVRPGRYLAVVIPPGVSDWIEFILNNRARAESIEIRAQSSTQVTLKNTRDR